MRNLLPLPFDLFLRDFQRAREWLGHQQSDQFPARLGACATEAPDLMSPSKQADSSASVAFEHHLTSLTIKESIKANKPAILNRPLEHHLQLVTETHLAVNGNLLPLMFQGTQVTTLQTSTADARHLASY